MANNLGAAASFPGRPAHPGQWANFGFPGLDMRPASPATIGVFLAIGPEQGHQLLHPPPPRSRGLARACTTGHAIATSSRGFALGCGDPPWPLLVVIVVAIFLSVLTYARHPPCFVAYGVAMTGIGMLI